MSETATLANVAKRRAPAFTFSEMLSVERDIFLSGALVGAGVILAIVGCAILIREGTFTRIARAVFAPSEG